MIPKKNNFLNPFRYVPYLYSTTVMTPQQKFRRNASCEDTNNNSAITDEIRNTNCATMNII